MIILSTSEIWQGVDSRIKRSAVTDRTVLTPDLRLISLYEFERTNGVHGRLGGRFPARTWKDSSDYCLPTNITEANIGGGHSLCVSFCYIWPDVANDC